MRTFFVIAIVIGLVIVLAGLLAAALAGPAWLAAGYGCFAVVTMRCGLELIGDVWAAA